MKYISSVEGNAGLANGMLFADLSCGSPLTKDPISILHGDCQCPGLTPDEPMALVQADSSRKPLR